MIASSSPQTSLHSTHIALIDYGIGNLRSVQKALETVCIRKQAGNSAIVKVIQTSEPDVILSAWKVVLPGVGAFGDGMAGLRHRKLIGVLEELVQRGTPLLGICLGMQLLFENSEELGDHRGLGFIPGNVRRFATPGLKVPQTGWNQIQETESSIQKGSPLMANLPPKSYAYFNHSYYCIPSITEHWMGKTVYGIKYASIVCHGQLYGVQFHPEKSQQVGLQILENFFDLNAQEAA